MSGGDVVFNCQVKFEPGPDSRQPCLSLARKDSAGKLADMSPGCKTED